MTQAARVALWVPTVLPGGVGQSIGVTSVPAGAQAPVPSQWQAGGGGGPLINFADAAEIQAGTLAGEAVDPLGLRTELVRLTTIPAADMAAGPIAVSTATPNRLVKTDSAGQIASSMLIGVLDGGTF